MSYQATQELQTTNVREDVPVFTPSKEEAVLVTTFYNNFTEDYSLRSQGWNVLNNRTLTQFWDDCNYDYNQTVFQDPNNPVVQYSSGTTRDKSNTLIINLTSNYFFPSVTAFNDNQQIDYDISSVCKPLLRYQYINDGRPSESGKSKGYRYTHKQTIEGTVHILDVIGEDGKLTSQIIPNEEVFIPNYFQPDIQLQAHFLWVQQWAAYAEAEAEFGECPNFKYVVPGSLGWLNQTNQYKERYKGIVYNNQCTIVRGWYPVKKSEIEKLIKAGKLPKGTKKARYFNVVINGVPMFAWDNLMPYYHGELPITKAVFEHFSPSEFYWGNSMPNKCAQDKHFRDGWMTLMRYVAKLQGIPAMINASGQHLENDVYVPGQTTDVPMGTDPNLFFEAPGTNRPGIIGQMMQMLSSTDNQINESTVSPLTSGMGMDAPHNARVAAMINDRATEILTGLAQRIAEREEARAFPILKATFQFLPRQKIKMLSIPNEIFPDGSMGNLEIAFQKLPPLTDDEKLQVSHQINDEEQGIKRGKDGKVIKQHKPIQKRKIMFINPEYVQNIDIICEAIAEDLKKNNGATKIAEAEHKWQTYIAAPPGIFNVKPAARNLVRAYGDNEKELISDQQPGQPQPGQPPMAPQGATSALPGQSGGNTAPLTPTGLPRLNPTSV